MTNVERLLRVYLDIIGIRDYKITESQEDLDRIYVLYIPKSNNERIGILKGKESGNLLVLKKLVKIVGPIEGINPTLIIKLTE